jgi:hypothetical protein
LAGKDPYKWVAMSWGRRKVSRLGYIKGLTRAPVETKEKKDFVFFEN